MSTESAGYIVARRDENGALQADWDGCVHRTLFDGQYELREAREQDSLPWELFAIALVSPAEPAS